MTWFNIKTGQIKKPEQLDNFNIPVLIKKQESYCSMSGITRNEVFKEAFTDGFYYEKDCIKYFRVRELDTEAGVYLVKENSYIPKYKINYIRDFDLVFLTKC